MPNPESKTIFVWPSVIENRTIESPTMIQSGHDENCLFQLLSGSARVRHGGKEYPLGHRDLVLIGRDRSVEILGDRQSCQILLLTLHHVSAFPSFDLNHLCLQASHVDSFFGQKTRFCIIQDRQHIHVTMGALRYEWVRSQPEKELTMSALLTELFIKLARSFYESESAQTVGTHYLAQARAYIQQNYQRDLTVQEIADHVGVSRSYLFDLFSRYMSRSVVTYIQAVRCDRAAFLLSTTRFPIIDIAAETGFNSRQHFYRTFRAIYGVSPREYRELGLLPRAAGR